MIRFQGPMIAPEAVVPEAARITRPIGRPQRILAGGNVNASKHFHKG
jgi:hypothetical protein